jgi:acetolactate synthase-1/2/3 large subunit
VLTTVNGKGILDESHPLAIGAAIRLRSAHAVIADSDVLLVVGSELGDSDLWGGVVQPSGPVIRIDVDAAQLHKNVRADVPILADAATALGAVAAGLPSTRTANPDRAATARSNATQEAATDGDPWRPLQEALYRALPDDVIVAGDSSRVTYYGTVHFWPFDRPGRLLYPTGYATLGYGLPAAIGAAVGTAGPVVAVVGDGAFMFSIQELTTAVEQHLPLPVIVVDNGGYGEIKAQMIERGYEPLGVDLARPDFVAMARAMGCHGVSAPDADTAAAEAAKALSADRPTLIYLAIDA